MHELSQHRENGTARSLHQFATAMRRESPSGFRFIRLRIMYISIRAAHVNRGISCVHCHGRYRRGWKSSVTLSHSMAFCPECHREPEKFIRPIDEVTNLAWSAGSETEQLELGKS